MTPATGFPRLLFWCVGGLFWLVGSPVAQPLHAQPASHDEIVTLTLPHLIVDAEVDTIVMPVELRNALDRVGGLQLDLAYGVGGLTLTAARPARRTLGWIVQIIPLPDEGSSRLLLYDPAGSNILPGVGPVMELVFQIPASNGLSAYAPLEVKAVIVSSQAGIELPAAGIDGSLTIGEVVVVGVGSVEADHGDTVSLAVSLVNRVPLAGLAFNVAWTPDFLEILDVRATARTALFPVSWGPADGGAWVRLEGDEGQVLEPGKGPILELRLAVAAPLPATDIAVHLEEVRLAPEGLSSGAEEGRRQAVSTVTSGRVRVHPGRLDPPRELVGLAGQEAQVSLSWIPVPSAAGETVPLTGYTVYRSLVSPVPVNAETRIATLTGDRTNLRGPQPGFVDTTVVNRQTYHYVVTANYGGRFASGPSNEISATPVRWMQLSVGHAKVTAGDQGTLPIMLRNDAPVAGIRFELWGLPGDALSVSAAILGQRVPPDWVISLDRDTVRNVLTVVGLSPRLNTIPPGEGVVISLAVDARDATPVRAPLEAREVVISDTSGRPYPSRSTSGSVAVDVELAQLRVGTGVPIQPGDTGYVSLFMDNPQPVMAFQLIVRPASGGLELLDVTGGTHLPADAHVDYSDLGKGVVRVIVSSFSNVPIPVGRGPVVTLAYRVDPDTPEGLIGLVLQQVVLSDARGVTLRQTTVSGSFPVGEVQAIFSPAASEGEPGRTVTVSVGLVNSVDLRGFEITVGFDPQYLSLLTVEALERIPNPWGLDVASIDSGRVRLTYAGVDGGEPIAAGSGPLFDLVLRLDAQLPRDTTLSLDMGSASARGSLDKLVFAVGQEAVIAVGQAPLTPTHFAADFMPTGVTHIIRAQAVTLGGVYLREGDELAAIDSGGWINSQGDTGSLVAGVGVVQADGSVEITATVGFNSGERGSLLPGARPGDDIIFLGWKRQSNVEGRPGRDARYILGAGVWGENNGLTIIDLIRLPEEAGSVAGDIPDELTVEFLAHDPFGDTTRIRFGVPMEMEVRVSIFDLLGRELITLHDGLTAAGFHEVEWDGADRAGVLVKSGMVFYQVRTPSQTITRKLLLMR